MPDRPAPATLVGQVTATIGAPDTDDATGPIDVNLLPDGTVEIDIGSGWATLTEDAGLALADVLIRSYEESRRRAADDPAVAHLRWAVEALGLVWPT